MATHSSTLTWEIPWRSPVGYRPRGRKESDKITTEHTARSVSTGKIQKYSRKQANRAENRSELPHASERLFFSFKQVKILDKLKECCLQEREIYFESLIGFQGYYLP